MPAGDRLPGEADMLGVDWRGPMPSALAWRCAFSWKRSPARRWRDRLAGAALACLLATGAHAEVPETPRLRSIGVADGLPSSTVAALALDRAGYLWIGTRDGLARYDGVG